MIAIGESGMAHANAIRVNQSLIPQPQFLFGYGKQRRESPICQATPNDVRLRSILRRKGTLVCKETLHTETQFHSEP